MRFTTLAIGLSALALATAANAAPSIVTNGGFEDTTNGGGQIGFNTDITGWTSGPAAYNFVFTPGTGDTGVTSQFGSFSLHGPANGTNNGLPATSPLGGNYLALDGAFSLNGGQDTGVAISQTLSTIIGHTYAITFAYAGAQQFGFDGDTTEQVQVSFGNQTQSTPVLNNVSHGFTGWQTATFNFTAQTTSDVLSFLAIGTPQGVPPFVLLDGVVGTDVTPTPEAATLGLLGLGLGLVGIARRRK